ncbi:hypothetical protein HETIRDRAFT_429265 [Heterobasidion irregulare TC 32-1]|uniref:Uncharacterized protein n=1 Tax=Heterobasidion irregulare (strain TC 32-1) TaxID=747525 RepID=W4JXD3_HETIT|nr:uncharacterized protein HETIRDRAFT_429265 [Heterobasidion irregulare TC 32-1]ETW78208.1 hypothetical protein HETIRDRAFT_429265 [Heterobasidion irregulare TC 32-1]
MGPTVFGKVSVFGTCRALFGISPKLPEYLPLTLARVHAHQRDVLRDMFSNEEESWKELSVDILRELIRVDEESLWSSVIMFVPGGCVRVGLEGEHSDLETGASQSSRLPCQKVSESLEGHGCGHLYYHGDSVALEKRVFLAHNPKGPAAPTFVVTPVGSGTPTGSLSVPASSSEKLLRFGVRTAMVGSGR